MNTRILNRNFEHPADGWYDIEAKGKHPNKQSRIIQVVDDTAMNAIVAAFNREAASPDFPGMLIDHEHFKHDDDKETIAYGWLMRLRNRGDAIQGQIRWSDLGQQATDGGRYRFFSTEYAIPEMPVVNRDSKPYPEVRPMILRGLTLTNVNNNKGQKPITNREIMETITDEQAAAWVLNGGPGSGPRPGEGRGGATTTSEQDKYYDQADVARKATMKATHLGLVADSSGKDSDRRKAVQGHEAAMTEQRHASGLAHIAGDDQMAKIHQSVSDQHQHEAQRHSSILSGHQEPANNRLSTGRLAGSEHPEPQPQNTTMKSVLSKLGLPEGATETQALAAVETVLNRNKTLETQVLDADLARYDDRIDPKQKEFVKSMLVTNREGAIAFLEAQPKRATAPGRVINRGEQQENPANVLNANDDASKASEIAEEISKLRAGQPKLSYGKARDLVRNRRPQLFTTGARAA